MIMNEIQILTLLFAPRIGAKYTMRVLKMSTQAGSDAKDLLQTLEQVKAQYPRMPLPTQEELAAARAKGFEVLKKCRAMRVSVIGWDNTDYPTRLRTIPDPPPLLYVKGTVNALNRPIALAVVGTRTASDYGMRVARRLGEVLAENHVVVVSGLALGCDTAVHKGCLDAGGCTVAVLAHGLDSVYPKRNSELADRIASSSGALVSEHPPGTPPRRRYFVARNRLQSGLSDAVIVVETDVKGGAMHTTRFCLEQGRFLAAYSYRDNLRYVSAQGNEFLIEKGNAVPLHDVNDIIRLLNRVSGSQQPLDQSRRDLRSETSEAAMQLSLF